MLSREVEAGRDEAANVDPADETCGTSQAYGLIPPVLTPRSFENRRQLASYVGIPPIRYRSGGMDEIEASAGQGDPTRQALAPLPRLRAPRPPSPASSRGNRHSGAPLGPSSPKEPAVPQL